MFNYKSLTLERRPSRFGAEVTRSAFYESHGIYPNQRDLSILLREKEEERWRAQAEGRGQILCFPRATIRVMISAWACSVSSVCAVWDGTLLFINQAQTFFHQHCCSLKIHQKLFGFSTQSSWLITDSLYRILLLTSDNDFKDVGKIHHLGEHIHDVGMIPGSIDELLQRQLTWRQKIAKMKMASTHFKFKGLSYWGLLF